MKLAEQNIIKLNDTNTPLICELNDTNTPLICNSNNAKKYDIIEKWLKIIISVCQILICCSTIYCVFNYSSIAQWIERHLTCQVKFLSQIWFTFILILYIARLIIIDIYVVYQYKLLDSGRYVSKSLASKSNINIVYNDNDNKNEIYMYINDINSSTNFNQVYDELCQLDNTKNLNIYITTNGGNAIACNKVCKKLNQWSGTTRTYVTDYAYSAGTMIALTTDELYMSKNATLSAINPINEWYDKRFICSILPRLFLSGMYNPELISHASANFLSQYINKKYNVDNIMHVMYKSVNCHATLFDLAQMNEIVKPHYQFHSFDNVL